MKRRTTEEARRALLDAATTQLHKQLASPDVSAYMAFLDLHDISAAAGYRGTSMIYSLWDEPANGVPDGLTARDRFARDVIAESAASTAATEVFTKNLADALLQNAHDPTAMVRDFANAEFRSFAVGGERAPSLTAYLWALTMTGDDETRSRLVAHHGPTLIENLAAVYVDGLPTVGRQLKPGLEASDIALLMRALINGLLIEEKLQTLDTSKGYVWEGRPDWTLFAVGSYSMMMGMTDPIEDDPGRPD